MASYFAMLESGLRGESFNKKEHNRALVAILNDRTPGAVEFKHQNISAILIEAGIPYISGYKPLGNYQGLLREVVMEQLVQNAVLRALIQAEAARTPPPPTPTFDEILKALTDPPKPRPGMDRRRSHSGVHTPVDYVLLEARNQALGRAGEEFVVNLERARLEAAGKEQLAGEVSHVAVERGDGLGYDVLSYEADSRERLIEVKTTKFGEYTPFYVTSNELEVSRAERHHYHLFRVYGFGPDPRVFTLAGALDESATLSPNTFVARVN